MELSHIPFREDIAALMTPATLDHVGATLERTARSLGMFEAYAGFARSDQSFEPMTDSDRLTVMILEDIHDRASALIDDAETRVDAGHTDGYLALMRLKINDKIPSLEDIRSEASGAIAAGFNVEEDVPEFGSASILEVTTPFDMVDPYAALRLDDEADSPSM